tara:strand:+ start:890 stop:2236 length:1347 start_codon:yes stop_codon:yes gene_type:complete
LIHINQKSNLITNKISFVIILLFPLFYIIGSAVLNFGVVILSLMFLASLNKNQLKILINDNLFKVFLIFFIYLILSNLMFTYNEYSLIKSIFYIKFLFFPFAIYFFLKNFSKKQKKIYNYFNISLVFFVSLDAIVQYYYGQNLLGYISPMGDRLSGVFNQEMVIGSFLYLVGIINCILFIEDLDKNNKSKIILSILFSLIAFVVIFSGERASLLMLIMFIILNIIFNEHLRKKFILIFVTFVLFFYLFINFSDNLKYRYWDHLYILTNLEKVELIDETYVITSKINKLDAIEKKYDIDLSNLKQILFKFKDTQWGSHWITAYKIFEDNPYFGAGFRSFRFECSNEKYNSINSLNKMFRCSTHPHNIFLEIISETGILGLTLFMLIIFFSFFKFYKHGSRNFHAYILFTIIITIIFPLKPSGALFSSWYGSILWYLFGIFFYKAKLLKI